MKEIFYPEGYLDNNLPGYEYRESQLQMADFIYQRLCAPENGIVEAGTGTGKSMAYLIPALKYAVDHGKKISLSTETKALQQQLLDKDIPLVKKIFREHFSRDFKYSLCLGSANYPCKRRFEIAVKKGAFTGSDLPHLNRVSALFKEKKIFTFFDAEIPSPLWLEINRDPEVCLQQRCHLFNTCAFQAAKREWAQSDLLVMNHYLFFSNIASGKAYLPVTDAVIFDEAHSIETIAAKQLGFSIDYETLVLLLQRFHAKGQRGVINSFKKESIRDEALRALDILAKEAQIFFEKIREHFIDSKNIMRLTKPLNFGDPLTSAFRKFLLALDEAESDLDEDDERPEFDSAKGRIMAYAESFYSFITLARENYVYWIERKSSDLLGSISLMGQPVEICSTMQIDVFSFYESSIFVSATLSVKNDFSFFISTTGFINGKGIVLESPFNFKKQISLYLAGEIPSPEQSSYPAVMSRHIIEIINILNGNCLILFTSYRMLKEVKDILSAEIPHTIYSQDEMSASRALKSYVEDNNSVLMGTHSFWQGIDLPGDLLRGVVITRLPFAVPDTPVMEAKFERLKEMGKNPFIHLQIPEAALKLKQGAGRLIRRGDDKGIVAILDSRIVTKSYGSVFVESLPSVKAVKNLKDLTAQYKTLLKIYEN
jgi:ATP-dependent DNA helicase DinG